MWEDPEEVGVIEFSLPEAASPLLPEGLTLIT
jgi:hypothetical protein